jgi:hypothetical protein
MCGSGVGRGGSGWRHRREQRRGVHTGQTVWHAKESRQGRLREHEILASQNAARAGRRKLRVGPGRVGARSQLVVGQRLGRAPKRAAVDVGLRGGDGLLGLHHRQKCARHRSLHLEPCEAFAGPRASQRGFGASHLCSSETEVERLP